jgi:hypothetical protein
LQAKRVNKKKRKEAKKAKRSVKEGERSEKSQKKRKREEILIWKTLQNEANKFFLKLGSSSCKRDAKIYITCSASLRYETKRFPPGKAQIYRFTVYLSEKCILFVY